MLTIGIKLAQQVDFCEEIFTASEKNDTTRLEIK